MDKCGFHLVLFVLSLFCHMTTCWILRLPCKTEANFSISAAGYALDHNVFVRLTMSLEDCKIHCMYTNNCQSLNYKVSGSENCELNRETNVSKPKDLVKKSDWTYYATNQKTTQIGSYCQREQPCKENEVCIDDCVCPGYRCTACSKENISIFCSALSKPSCKNIYAKGFTTSGIYSLDEIGDHYCLMDGDCGQGGWTLAMKVDGTTNTFVSNSPLWTNGELHRYTDTNLNNGNAKFDAFKSVDFKTVCIGMKTKGAAIDTIKWLKIPKWSSSLLDVFSSDQTSYTNLRRQAWEDLVPEISEPLQINCNRQGFNINDDRYQFKIRIGILGNNENDCVSIDSAIGVGTSNTSPPYSGSFRWWTREFVHSSPKQVFIFVQ